MNNLAEKIAVRLTQVEPWAPNYFGRVPDDYEEVVENTPLPTVEDVLATNAIKDDPHAIDCAIAEAIVLPAGYEGVGVDVRVRPEAYIEQNQRRQS